MPARPGSVLVQGGVVVTMDRRLRTIKDGSVLIEDGVITKVGKDGLTSGGAGPNA